MAGQLSLLDVLIATPQGFNDDGVTDLANGAPPDREMTRPAILKGRVLQIDPMSGLVASLAGRLRRTVFPDADPKRVGLVVASRYGNRSIMKSFADRVRRGGQSPVQFAASGYNVAVCVGAMAGNFNGPGLVLAGEGANLAAAVKRARHLLWRGDAHTMLACIAESSREGTDAIAGAIVLCSPGATALSIDEHEFLEAASDSLASAAVSRFAPWVSADLAHLLRLEKLRSLNRKTIP